MEKLIDKLTALVSDAFEKAGYDPTDNTAQKIG